MFKNVVFMLACLAIAITIIICLMDCSIPYREVYRAFGAASRAKPALGEAALKAGHLPDIAQPAKQHELLKDAPPARFEGPFKCGAMTFYFVHHGGPMKITLNVTGRVFYSFCDAQERRIKEEYYKGASASLLVADTNNAEAGIYQLRTVGGGGKIDVKTEPAMSFGILNRRARLYATVKDQFSQAYIYVPYGVTNWRTFVYAGNGVLRDLKGNVLAELKGTSEVKVTETDTVWRLQLSLIPDSSHNFAQSGDFDAILCPDEQTARNIRGSRQIASDGRQFPHRYQVEMWEWIRRLKPQDIEFSTRPDMRQYEKEFLKEPRNIHLLHVWGVFSHLPYILANQTLNNPHREFSYPPDNGPSTSHALAVAYSLNKPFNPFYHDQRILNRLLLSEFSRYLENREHDTPHDLAPETNYYPAPDSMHSDNRDAYALVAPMLEDERIRALWTEGARRQVELWAFSRVSCENQTAHTPKNLYALYLGSGNEIYKKLAADFIEDMLDPGKTPQMRVGYLCEGYGPDATYQGITADKIAHYYLWSRDEKAKEGLRRMYYLFNHTVAPEPDGKTILGAANFSHRTAGSWVERQYGGGTYAMSPYLEEAAAWHQDIAGENLATDANMGVRSVENIRNRISADLAKYWYGDVTKPIAGDNKTRDIYRSVYWMAYNFHPEHVIQGAVLPVMASERFERNFGNEFYAVRRPSYYALVYVGKPDPPGCHSDSRFKADAKVRRTGGGLSMFWTPGFGSAILSHNWNAYVNQMIRADYKDGAKVDWPDYDTLEHTYDADNHILTSTCRMMGLPMAIKRTLSFREDFLQQDIELTFEGNIEIERLVEQIPFPVTDKIKLNGDKLSIYSLVDGIWQETPPDGAVGGVRLVHKETGEGVEILFSKRQVVRMGRQTAGQGQVTGSGLLEIHLGNKFTKGQSINLNYRLTSRSDIL